MLAGSASGPQRSRTLNAELLLFKASGLQGRAREATRGPQRIRTLNAEGLQAFISPRLPAFKGERGRPLTPTEDRDGTPSMPRCWLSFFKTRQYQVEHQWVVANILLSALTVPGFTQVVYKAFIISRFSNTLKHLLAKFTAGKHYSTPSQPWKW